MSLKLKIQQDEQEGCLTQKFNTVTLANHTISLWKCPAKNNYFDHNFFFFFVAADYTLLFPVVILGS